MPIMLTFKAWMLINEPRFLEEADRERLIERLDACRTNLTHTSKAEFFTEYQSVVMRLGVTQV